MNENDLSKVIVDAAIEVHRTLGGPGLLESVYQEALALEIGQRGLVIEREKSIPIRYKDQVLATSLRIDILVNDLVVVECKASIQHNPIFETQLLTYLRVLDLRLGLLINFGQRLVKDGIRRVVNGL